MNRRTMPRQREKPRRKAPERIAHVRSKPVLGAPPTTEEKAHMTRVAALGCLVSGRPATLHHVTASIHGGRTSRSHKRVVPLAPEYHLIQHGPRSSVEALGHRRFYETHGIDLLAEAERLWRETVAMTHGGTDA